MPFALWFEMHFSSGNYNKRHNKTSKSHQKVTRTATNYGVKEDGDGSESEIGERDDQSDKGLRKKFYMVFLLPINYTTPFIRNLPIKRSIICHEHQSVVFSFASTCLAPQSILARSAKYLVDSDGIMRVKLTLIHYCLFQK